VAESAFDTHFIIYDNFSVIYTSYNQSASPQILGDLSSVFAKKVGDFLKQGSGSLVKSGLKIPRSYFIYRKER
jgi:hypothetical protein